MGFLGALFGFRALGFDFEALSVCVGLELRASGFEGFGFHVSAFLVSLWDVPRLEWGLFCPR